MLSYVSIHLAGQACMKQLLFVYMYLHLFLSISKQYGIHSHNTAG